MKQAKIALHLNTALSLVNERVRLFIWKQFFFDKELYKFQTKVNYLALVSLKLFFCSSFSRENAMWQAGGIETILDFSIWIFKSLVLAVFRSWGSTVMQCTRHLYTTVLMVSLMAHLHIIISIKSPCFIAPAFATEARVFIYPSPGTQFSSSFTYLQGKNETFQGYGLVFSLIFKFLCRHNFMFIRNCKRFCTLSKTKFIKELNNL